MMFNRFTSCVLLCAFLHLNLGSVNGLCLPCFGGKIGSRAFPGRRSVYSPQVIQPSAGTIRMVGSMVNVTWDTRDMSKDVTNPTGKLLLGQVVEEDENEHLDFSYPLVAGFDLGDGHVECIVPMVEPDHSCIIVLMVDSGNRSPAFKIAQILN